MDRDEQLAGALAIRDDDAIDALALRGFDPREPAVGKPEPRRVIGMHLDQRLLAVARELRREAGARHRMPLVTIAAGVEGQRPFSERFGERFLGYRHEPRASVFGRKAAVGEGMIAAPAKGRHRIISDIAALRGAGEREEARAVIVIGRQAAMLAPDVGRAVVGEGGLPAHPPRDFLDDPPVGHRFARQRKQRALAADRAVAVGDSAIFLAPRGGGKADMRKGAGVGLFDHVADDDEGAGGEGLAHAVRVGHRHRGVGRHHPQRLDAALAHRAEQVDRF